jgi:hypothetical protein
MDKVKTTLREDFTREESYEFDNFMRLFPIDNQWILYSKHAIQYTSTTSDINELFDIEKDVSRLVFLGYDSLREMFNRGYLRAKLHLQDLVDAATTPELVMLHRLDILRRRQRLRYYNDRLNEIDEKYDDLEKYGDSTSIDLTRRLRYMARNYDTFLGFDIGYMNDEGNHTILRYHRTYDNLLFP